jgi:hypothetical protein
MAYAYYIDPVVKKVFIKIPNLQDNSSIKMYIDKTISTPQSDPNDIVAYFNDGSTINGFRQVGNGIVSLDTTTFSFPALRKHTNCDPNGAEVDLNYQIIHDFKLYVMDARFTTDSCSYDRYCLVNVNNDGYGPAVDPEAGLIMVDERSRYSGSPTNLTTISSFLNQWIIYEGVLNRYGWAYKIWDENYENLLVGGQYSFTPATYVYSKFAILGGKPYYCRRVIAIPYHTDVTINLTQIKTNLYEVEVINNSDTTFPEYTIELNMSDLNITDPNTQLRVLESINNMLFSPTTSNDVYYFDTNNRQFVSLGKTRDELTSEDFEVYGNKPPLQITKSELLQLDINVDILTPSGPNDSIQITKVPNPGVAIAELPVGGLLQVIDIQVDQPTLEDKFKVLLSPNNTDWYKIGNDNNWQLVIQNLDPNNPDHVDTVLNEGNLIVEVSNITSDKYRELLGDNVDNIYIAIAVEYDNPPTVVKVVNIKLIVDTGSTFQLQAPNTDYTVTQSMTDIQITFNSDGTYIVYYMD